MGKSRKQQIILAQQFFDKGCDQWYAYEYDEALEEFMKSLVLREALLGKYHAHTSRTYFSMGCALHGKGDGSEALIALRRTMRIAVVKKDKGRIQAAKDYINWVMKKEGGQSDKKIKEYIKRLEVSIDHESKGDSILSSNGDKEKAIDEYKQALDIEAAEVGTAHTDVADLYVKIADATQKGQEKTEYYEKAIKIYRESFGDDHTYVTQTMEKVDPAKASQKKDTAAPEQSVAKQISAQELLKFDQNASHVDKAVKHFHRQDKSDFYKTGKCYDSAGRYFWMGVGFHMNNKPDEALVSLRRAWRMRDAAYGREHHLTRHTLGWISDVLLEQGRPVGPYHKSMYQSVEHQTNGYKLLSQGKKIPALREFQRAAELERSSVGKNHLEYADLKVLIAELQAERSDYAKALEEYKVALLIFQSAFGRQHPRTAGVFGKMDALSKSSNMLLSVSGHSRSSTSSRGGVSRGARRTISGLGRSTRGDML